MLVKHQLTDGAANRLQLMLFHFVITQHHIVARKPKSRWIIQGCDTTDYRKRFLQETRLL